MDLQFIDLFSCFDGFKKFLWAAVTEWTSNNSHYSICFLIVTWWFKKALDIDYSLQDTDTGRAFNKDIC